MSPMEITFLELKSTPPAWAGTERGQITPGDDVLKSTPPAWAGTMQATPVLPDPMLKSTPPAWAGTRTMSPWVSPECSAA